MNKDQEFIDGYEHISKTVADTNKHLQDFRDGKINPIKTKSKKEQEKIGGFLPGEQITVAGRTGTGKSAFILQWMQDFINPIINPETAADTIILFDTWEMLPWRHMLRLYSSRIEWEVKRILDYKKQLDEESFRRVQALGELFKNQSVYFSHVSQNVEEWGDTKKRIRDKYPDKTIINIVDHTRLVTPTTEKSEQELIHKFMVKGMKLKLELDMINFFISQMNRNIESGAANRESIGRNLPVSSDIFGADSVYQCSDAVIALHRPGFYGLTDWEGIPTGKTTDPNSSDDLMIECILKQRDGWTGNLTMRHNLALNRIVDYD